MGLKWDLFNLGRVESSLRDITVSTAPMQILAEALQAHSEPIEAHQRKCRSLPSDADQDGQVQTLQGGFSLGL
jgi:hypothetical protein